MSDGRATAIEDLETSVATTGFLMALGVETVGDLLALPKLRANRMILGELRVLFDELDVSYEGQMEVIAYEVPKDRRVPCLRVRYEAGGDGERASRIGGEPSDWAGSEWPTCKQCKKKLRFLAQVCGPLSLGTLALAKDEAVQIFSCLDDDSKCATYDADSGATVALLRTVGASARSGGAAPFPPHRMVTSESFDDDLLLADEDDDDGDEENDNEAGGYSRDLAYSEALAEKLGGIVAAGNDPAPETCKDCGETLTLLAQLGRDPVVPNPSDDATWIVRVCPKKHVVRAEWTR